MENEFELIIDPSPRGWMYGFPKALPQEAIAGEGTNMHIKTGFDLDRWLVAEGYPQELIGYWKTYVREK